METVQKAPPPDRQADKPLEKTCESAVKVKGKSSSRRTSLLFTEEEDKYLKPGSKGMVLDNGKLSLETSIFIFKREEQPTRCYVERRGDSINIQKSKWSNQSNLLL